MQHKYYILIACILLTYTGVFICACVCTCVCMCVLFPNARKLTQFLYQIVIFLLSSPTDTPPLTLWRVSGVVQLLRQRYCVLDKLSKNGPRTAKYIGYLSLGDFVGRIRIYIR